MAKALAPLLLLAVHQLVVVLVNGECRVFNKTRVTCDCNGNEEFLLPEGYNYENVTSLELSSCSSAYLHYASLTEANQIKELIIRNISETLTLELFLTTRQMKLLKLSSIGRIPLVTHDTFITLKKIERFELENALIEDFEEQFDNISITDFVMKNVTIKRIGGVYLAEGGNSLRITDSRFQTVATSLKFAYFHNVEITNSTFGLLKQGHVSIEADEAVLVNNVFSNVSINVVASKAIKMISSCADGRSSLRLSAHRIESFDNRLPTEIIYAKSKPPDGTGFFINRNNTVCRAGNCNCPKSNGQPPIESNFLLPIFLLANLILSLYF